jgi:nicotinamide phosphoribosyltransferase
MFDAYAKPGAIFATVIDSFNWVEFIREIAPQFKQRLIDSGSTWVFRPDSGDPIETPIQVVRELDKVFGHTVNKKGFKVLNNVRVIQGDGITEVEVKEILRILLSEGYSATNIAFGMGGGLLRKHDRDTLKFSMKCCAMKRNGFWFDVYKDPATYDKDWNKLDVASFKKSIAGRLLTIYRDADESWMTIREDEMPRWIPEGYRNMMEVVYENGQLKRDMTFAQVRKNAKCA